VFLPRSLDEATRGITRVILKMEESEFISRIGFEIRIWIQKFRVRCAEVLGVTSSVVELKSFLEGRPKEVWIVSSGEKSLVELAKMDNLVGASGDKSEDTEDARNDDAGSNGRRMSGVPRYEKVEVERLFIECSEENRAVKVDCDVKKIN